MFETRNIFLCYKNQTVAAHTTAACIHSAVLSTWGVFFFQFYFPGVPSRTKAMYHYCGVTSKCCYSPDFHSCYQSSLYVDQVKKEQPPSTWGSHMAMGKEIRIAARKNTTGYKAHSWRHCCKINMFEQFQQVKRCLSLLLLHLNLKHFRMLFAREDIGKLPSSPPKDLNTQTRIIRISKFCNWHPEPQEEILIKTIGTYLSWNWPFFCCWLRICVILCHKDP